MQSKRHTRFVCTGRGRRLDAPANAAKRPVRNRLCGALIRGLQNLEISRKGTSLFFLLLQKEPKSSRDSVLRPRFKTLRKNFFVTFPAFVPKPVCDATHFFGCFEPVRKGYCSADARLIFFENGIPHCKLTGANVFKKGGCSLSWLRWEFVFAVCGLKVLS